MSSLPQSGTLSIYDDSKIYREEDDDDDDDGS